MVIRLEIPRDVKLTAWKRAGGPDALCCEGCGRSLRGETPHYDHRVPEWVRTEPREQRTITAGDVQVLGAKCCHAKKTATEATQRAHGNRLIDKQAGTKRRKSKPILGSRESGWKKTFYDGWERR